MDVWQCPKCSLVDVKEGHVCLDVNQLLYPHPSLFARLMSVIR